MLESILGRVLEGRYADTFGLKGAVQHFGTDVMSIQYEVTAISKLAEFSTEIGNRGKQLD